MKTEKYDFYNSTTLKSYNLDDKIRYQLKMLEGLDTVTRKHSESVANLTCRLCEYLHMDKGFTVYCTTCAYIHDLGKLFIPSNILQKNSKLTDEEYQIMKTHTTIGYEMCMKDPKLRPYAAGTISHHEALNGSGYPNGLLGKKIPYEGQIIRVADEFDAITAKRQYKTHIGIVETLNILISETKPNPNAKDKHVGKIDKKILKALFKIVIDDTEYEIVARIEYLNYLKKEIKRLKTAEKYFEKMDKTKNAEKKEYFRQYARYYLHPNEKVDLIPQIIKEMENAYKQRKDHIEKLYREIKQIKRLKV